MLRWFPEAILTTTFLSVRFGLSHFLLSALLFTASFGCGVACFLLQVAMIEGVNCKHNARAQFSYLSRDIFGIFDEHRHLYPKSNLRTALILTFGLFMASGFGFVLLQRLGQ